jgi:hypothetical protein
VWALVQKCEAQPFLEAWADAYRTEFPQPAEAARFFTTAAGPAAFQLC